MVMSSNITTAGHTSDQPMALSEPARWVGTGGAIASNPGLFPVVSVVGNGIPRLLEHLFYLGKSGLKCSLRLLAASRRVIDGNRNHLADVEVVAQASAPHSNGQGFAENIIKIGEILLER